MFVTYDYCVLQISVLCVGLITSADVSYRVCVCVCVCLSVTLMPCQRKGPGPVSVVAPRKNLHIYIYIYINFNFTYFLIIHSYPISFYIYSKVKIFKQNCIVFNIVE